MTVTSGIAGAIGVLLMFWNRVVGMFHRLIGKLRGSSSEPIPAVPPQDSQTPQA
jgi:hypothetical protein